MRNQGSESKKRKFIVEGKYYNKSIDSKGTFPRISPIVWDITTMLVIRVVQWKHGSMTKLYG
jgi:hypothetical protein